MIGREIKRQLMVPTFTEGVFGVTTVGGQQYRPATSKLKAELPVCDRPYSIHFNIASQDTAVRQVQVYLDSQMVQQIPLPANHRFTQCELIVPTGIHQKFHDLQLQAEMPAEQKGESPYKIAVSNIEIDHPRYRLYQILFENWFKEWGLRLNGISPVSSASLLDAVDTYDEIWAISDFTKRWIHSYWGHNSCVVNPPIDVDQFAPGEKHPWIINAGRFFEGSHNKKHLAMIRAFKEMLNEGLQGWELHLVGGTSPSAIQQEYLQRVIEEARGYPIVVHTDVSFQELVQLYAQSSIYWHASGFGEDENREPIKFEHFGITTVEAMASGCVPVVIARGGQPEIVRHGYNGFLWNSIRELKGYTKSLIEQPILREKMADTALHDSRKYDKNHFQANVQQALQRINA
jgi:glycosyltransferase involved in cell wall biosynthesis